MKIFLTWLLSAILVGPGLANVPTEIDDATSPDGKFILQVVGADSGDQKSHIEIKTLPAGEVVGKISESDYEEEGIDFELDAVWNEDSSGFALNVSEGRNSTGCRVFAKRGEAWKEVALPEKEIDRVRSKANTEGGKTQDYLYAEAWLSPGKLELRYQGNTGKVYQVICRLTGGNKPRLAFVESIAPELESETESEPVEPKNDYEDYVFTVLAGGTPGSNDGVGVAAQFKIPKGVAVDSVGNVFVADTGNHVIRKITADGMVSTLAGLAGNSGEVDGAGTAARFFSPESLAPDTARNLYVVDSGSDVLAADATIRKVTSNGTVSTVADSKALKARTPRHDQPEGEASAVAVDKSGVVYVVMESDYIIRKITPAGVVATLTGLAGTSGMVDGSGKTARLFHPKGLAADAKGNLYVADSSALRRIDPSGAVTTLAGSRDKSGSSDGIGSAAQFVDLKDVAVDSAGNIYGLDQANSNVRKITPAGVVKTLRDVHNKSPFHSPQAIAVDDKGWVYVANLDGATIVVGKPAK